MSGTGVLDAESSSVLTPTMNGTDPTPVHVKLIRRSAGANGPVANIEKTKV